MRNEPLNDSIVSQTDSDGTSPVDCSAIPISGVVSAEDQVPPDRLTVVESIYHQSPSHSPTTIETRYGRLLVDTEQPYLRTMEIQGTWTPIDFGWIGDNPLSLLHVANRAKPTSVRRVNGDSPECVIEVGIKVGTDPGSTVTMWDRESDRVVAFAKVSPGESCRFRPSKTTLNPLMIRCPNGKGIVAIAAVPE